MTNGQTNSLDTSNTQGNSKKLVSDLKGKVANLGDQKTSQPSNINDIAMNEFYGVKRTVSELT